MNTKSFLIPGILIACFLLYGIYGVVSIELEQRDLIKSEIKGVVRAVEKGTRGHSYVFVQEDGNILELYLDINHFMERFEVNKGDSIYKKANSSQIMFFEVDEDVIVSNGNVFDLKNPKKFTVYNE